MKAIINKVKSNLWWGAGFLCALLFSQGANAADVSGQAQAQTGDPGKVPQEEPRTSEREKGEITKLIEDYFSRTTALKPTIERLVEFGATSHLVLMDYIRAACDGASSAVEQAKQAEASGDRKLAKQWRAEQESASDSRECLVKLAQELETRQLAGPRLQLMGEKEDAERPAEPKVIKRRIEIKYGPPTRSRKPGPPVPMYGIYKPPPSKQPPLIPGSEAGQKIYVEKGWRGQVSLELKQEAPAGGYVANKDAWAKLWKAWRGNEDCPEVEFDKEIVLVVVGSDPNQISLIPRLDEKGNLRVTHGQTLLLYKDFKTLPYIFARIKREGIKTVNGVPIEENRPSLQ